MTAPHEPTAGQKVWNSFRQILRDAAFFPVRASEDSAEATLQIVKNLAMELSPDAFRVIDQALLKHAAGALTDERIGEISAHRKNEGLSALSREQILARELDRAAVLVPVELLSIPEPRLRAALVARFGSASSAACLRDLYELDSHTEVRAEVIHAVGRRLSNVSARDAAESSRLLDFSGEVVRAGYYLGRDIESARAALSFLRLRADSSVPEALKTVRTSYWSGVPVPQLGALDRIGVIRLYGDYMSAADLTEILEGETDYDVLAVLLPQLEENWNIGVHHERYGEHTVIRSELSRRIADTLCDKLGLAGMPLNLRNEMLQAERHRGEEPVRRLMRRLAYQAILESDDD